MIAYPKEELMSVGLDDLRRENRKFSEEMVVVRYINQSQNAREETHSCSSQDISAGGLKLVSHCPLELGSEMPMEIDLGSLWAVINVRAQVKWCLEIDDAPTYYIGVKLIEIEKSNRQVWKKFIEKL